MNKWLRFNRRHVCPVCNGARQDCRQNRETRLIHCREETANPVDYILRGQDIWGFNLWAYKPECEEWEREKTEEWRQQKERERKLIAEKEQKQRKQWLSVEERDKNIRKLLKQLKLSDEHKERLHRRGLTDEQIEAANYRSVKQWQELEGIDTRLPGINKRGNLNNATEGILIPIPDVNGLYVGLRINDPEYQNHEQSAKYKPLSSGKRGFTPHLQNGEMPLAVYGRELGGEVVGITEGYEYKPYIASIKLGIPIIGGGGSARVTSSPQTLKIILEKLKPKTIIIYPDSGSALNKNIVNSFEDSYQLLTEWGYQVLIAYWGQLEQKQKGDLNLGDIDEISEDAINSINLITIQEWKATANSDCQEKRENKGALLLHSQVVELAKKETLRHNQELEAEKTAIENQEKLVAWENYKSKKTFTAEIKINKQYLEEKDFRSWKDGIIAFLKSGLGTGKTTALCKVLKTCSDGCIGLGYRNALLLQFSEKSGFYHLHEHDLLNGEMRGYLDSEQSRVVNCVDSLSHFKDSQFEDKILIIDEFISVLKHTLFSTTIKSSSLRAILDKLTAITRKAKKVICIDGMLCDWAVKLFKKICPDKEIVTIENIHQGKKPKVYLLTATFMGKSIKKNETIAYFQKLLNEGKRIAVCSDSQILCEALENLFRTQGQKGLRVDSKTVNEPEIKSFLSNCDTVIKETKPDYLIYSPTAESGVDVSIKDYFTDFFGFFYGVIDADSIMQMIMRIRDPQLSRYVFVKTQSVKDTNVHNSYFAKILADKIRRLITKEVNLLDDPDLASRLAIQLENIKNDPFNITATEIMAMWNYEKYNLRDCVKFLLENNGHHVILYNANIDADEAEDYQLTKVKLKEAQEEVKQNNSHDIYNANDDYVGESSFVRLSYDASWSERCQLEKARILDRLPGLKESSQWSEDLVYRLKYGDLKISALERRYQLLNPSLALFLTTLRFKTILDRAADCQGLINPWRIKSDYLVIKALLSVGILSFLNEDNPHQHYTQNHPQIKALVKLGRQKAIADVLGPVGKYAIRYLKRLLKLIGINLKSETTKEQGKTVRRYYLDPASFDGVTIELMGFVATRYRRILSEQPVNETVGEMPVSPVAIEVSAATHLPVNIYKSGNMWPVESNTGKEIQGIESTLNDLDTDENSENTSNGEPQNQENWNPWEGCEDAYSEFLAWREERRRFASQ